MLAAVHAPDEMTLRLVIHDDAVEPTLDTAYPGDAVFDYADKIALVLDAQMADVLASYTLDVEVGAGRTRPPLILF